MKFVKIHKFDPTHFKKGSQCGVPNLREMLHPSLDKQGAGGTLPCRL